MIRKSFKAKSVWRRKKSDLDMSAFQDQKSSLDQLSDFKAASKRIAIMSRLESKQITSKSFQKTNKSLMTINRTEQKKNYLSIKRPSTSTNQQKNINSINSALKAFKQQKLLNEKALSKSKKQIRKGSSDVSVNVKQGLLGQYERYNDMSKHELIQKLISLEYLANNIFKKNKTLQEKIRSLDPSFKL